MANDVSQVEWCENCLKVNKAILLTATFDYFLFFYFLRLEDRPLIGNHAQPIECLVIKARILRFPVVEDRQL